jgi:hypothetical protein
LERCFGKLFPLHSTLLKVAFLVNLK